MLVIMQMITGVRVLMMVSRGVLFLRLPSATARRFFGWAGSFLLLPFCFLPTAA
jgi:hypothetical protein